MSSDDPPLFPSRLTLNNGNTMPSVGLGTFKIRQEDDVVQTIDYALAAGYRMIDTASVYGNEPQIKTALNHLLSKYGLERDDIFITTKLSPSTHGGRDITSAAYKKSLENLGLDYVDLYLIHFPGSAKISVSNPQNAKLRNMTWKAMTELYDEGLVNNIGVSNFTIKHLDDLMLCNYGVVPVVNQVEWHPYYHENDLLKYCKEHDIVLQAYGSLGGSASSEAVLEDPVVKKIANKHNATSAQVLLVWALQQGIAVIPKSTNPYRITENITFHFKLRDEEMQALDALGVKNIKYAWDPHPVV